jgi:hypothetical protein
MQRPAGAIPSSHLTPYRGVIMGEGEKNKLDNDVNLYVYAQIAVISFRENNCILDK